VERSGHYLAFPVREPWQLPLAIIAAWTRGLPIFPLSGLMTPSEAAKLRLQAGPPGATWNEAESVTDPEMFSAKGVSKDSLALILATSGSTAAPKLLGFRHGELLAAAQIEVRHNKLPEGSRILNLRPGFTSGGVNTIWPAFYRGDTQIFPKSPYHLPRAEAFAELLRASPNLIIASPAYLRALNLDLISRGIDIRGNGAVLYYGGAQLSNVERNHWLDRGFLPTMRYGMTECAHLLSVKEIRKPVDETESLSVGIPFSEVEIKEGKTLSFRAPGFAPWKFEAGVASPNLAADGWYISDDKGHRTEKGELMLEGRGPGLMVVAGFRVSGAEIEEAAMATQQCLDCVAHGIRDTELGTRIALLVEPADWGNLGQLNFELGKTLSPYKTPKLIEYTKKIPLTPNGKRDWRRIQSRLTLAQENLWERHFGLWKKLRENSRWPAYLSMRQTCKIYREAFEKRFSAAENLQVEKVLAVEGPGKHLAYQQLWLCNAMAFQAYRFSRDFPKARLWLQRALDHYPLKMNGKNHGEMNPAVEAFWLIPLLNQLRLDNREGKLFDAARKSDALTAFLGGCSLQGEIFHFKYEKSRYPFSFHPDLVAYLRAKISQENEKFCLTERDEKRSPSARTK